MGEKAVPNDTERSYVIASKVLPNLPSDDWHDEVVSSESLVSSMRNPRCCQGLFGKCHPRCCYLYRTRYEEDCHCFGCCLCFEEARTNFVRIRWINFIFSLLTIFKKKPKIYNQK